MDNRSFLDRITNRDIVNQQQETIDNLMSQKESFEKLLDSQQTGIDNLQRAVDILNRKVESLKTPTLGPTITPPEEDDET